MVIKLYISGISGNKEVKKKQQRVQMILDSKQITYEAIDITEPGKEKDKEFMQQNGKVRESLGKYPLPPQIFNDDDFCGDYEDFDMANEVDELEKFLHIATIENESKLNVESCKSSKKSVEFCESSKTSNYDPYDYHTFKIKWDNVNGLQEQIIINNNPAGENEQSEEVNGEAVHISESLTDNVGEKAETLTEEVTTSIVEDEVSKSEKDTVQENPESHEENNKKGTENEENEDKEEEEEKEKGKEEEVEVENPKEESEVEKPSEEESPHLMEEEKEKGGEEEEKEEEEEEEEVENPKEESEVEKPSEEESPHLMEETGVGESVDNENVEKDVDDGNENVENEDDEDSE